MLRIVLIAIWVAVAVAVRRIFVGARHPSWTYTFEVFIGVARKIIAMDTRLVARGRPFPRVPAAPLSREVRRSGVRIERGETAGCPSLTFTPRGWTPEQSTLLYLHGGGYIVCSPWTHRDLIGNIARLSGIRCVAIDYRKAPANPFPAAIDDSERAYQALLDEGVPPERLFLAGDSAGGGLCLALLQRNRLAGRAQPRAAALLSPWCTLHSDSVSVRDNAPYDYLPAHDLRMVADLYLGGVVTPQDPLASASFADLSGLPPLIVLSGELEVFRDDIELFAQAAEKAGTTVRLVKGDAMIHVWPVFAGYFPECRPGLHAVGEFLREHSGVTVANQQPA